MKPLEINIGSGPDYVQSRNKLLYFHRASLEINPVDGLRQIIPFYNYSLAQLLKELNQQILNSYFENMGHVEFDQLKPLSITFKSQSGKIVLRYHFISLLRTDDRQLIIDVFVKYFDSFWNKNKNSL